MAISNFVTNKIGVERVIKTERMKGKNEKKRIGGKSDE